MKTQKHTQTLLAFGVRERVHNRKIRQKACGEKVGRGVGRPRKKGKNVKRRQTREKLSKHTPIHVTLKLRDGMPKLRSTAVYPLIHKALSKYSLVTVAEPLNPRKFGRQTQTRCCALFGTLGF